MSTEKSKKSILYLITQSELGGAQKYIVDLCVALKDEYEVSVAFGEQGEKGGLAQVLREKNIKYYVIPSLFRKIDPQADFFALNAIVKLIKQVRPNILHLNSSKISILGALAIFRLKLNPFWHFRAQKIRVIYTVHGWVFHEPERNTEKYKSIERWSARFKDKIICVSEMDYQSALKEKISPDKKLVVVHNGIMPVNFLSRETAREKLNLSPDELVIGSVGYLYKNKGYEYLINAVKILIDNNLKLKLVIIGEGQERDELENWIRQYHLEKYVILTGTLEAAPLLNAFDIYVCSSVKEGLSYTIIEAMQAALPIIATQVGGNPELIENEKTGILIESAKPEAISQAIVQLINNPELAKQLGQSAQQKALSDFTQEKMISETKKVYELN